MAPKACYRPWNCKRIAFPTWRMSRRSYHSSRYATKQYTAHTRLCSNGKLICNILYVCLFISSFEEIHNITFHLNKRLISMLKIWLADLVILIWRLTKVPLWWWKEVIQFFFFCSWYYNNRFFVVSTSRKK